MNELNFHTRINTMTLCKSLDYVTAWKQTEFHIQEGNQAGFHVCIIRSHPACLHGSPHCLPRGQRHDRTAMAGAPGKVRPMPVERPSVPLFLLVFPSGFATHCRHAGLGLRGRTIYPGSRGTTTPEEMERQNHR